MGMGGFRNAGNKFARSHAATVGGRHGKPLGFQCGDGAAQGIVAVGHGFFDGCAIGNALGKSG